MTKTIPTIVGDPQFLPTINELPRVRFQVERAERFFDSGFEDATMRIWIKGQQMPIDRLEVPTLAPGETVLEGRGGLELLTDVEVYYAEEEALTAIEELISDNTSYTANVDDLASSLEEDTLLLSLDTNTDFENALLNAISSTDPFEASGGSLKPLQTCFTMEAEDFTADNGTNFFGSSDYSGDGPTSGDGESVQFEAAGEWAEWNFTTDYVIPAEDFEVSVRWGQETLSDDEATLDVLLDGETIGTLSTTATNSIQWADLVDTAPSSDVGAGMHTLRLEVATAGTDPKNIDVVAPNDSRYSYTFDDTLSDDGSGGRSLSGPGFYPSGGIEIVFDDVGSAAKSVVGAKIESTWNATDNGQVLALSNDGGDTYQTASNTDTLDVSFAEKGASVRARVTLSGTGTQASTPTENVNAQELQALDLYADLDSAPLIINQTFKGPLKDVITEICERFGLIWEYTRTGSTESVEVSALGQRTSDSTEAIVDYTLEKNTEDAYEKIIVEGGGRTVTEESFTADFDTAVSLANSAIIDGSQAVYDATQQFVEGEDYEMDNLAGEITVLSAGSMSDSTSYSIDYEYKVSGIAEVANAPSNPKTGRVPLPALTTVRACEHAASRILNEVDTPLHSARLVLSRLDAGRSVIDDVQFEGLPVDERYSLDDVTQSPGDVTIEAGSRASFGEVTDRYERQLAALSQQS